MKRVEENSSILVCISRLAKITTCLTEMGEIHQAIPGPLFVNLSLFLYLSQMVAEKKKSPLSKLSTCRGKQEQSRLVFALCAVRTKM